jgi:hypothetical protein
MVVVVHFGSVVVKLDYWMEFVDGDFSSEVGYRMGRGAEDLYVA